MRVVYTDEALQDLDGILGYIAQHYPSVSTAFENRLRTAVRRISAWPQSAPQVEQRPHVRVVPLVPYPYLLFYQVTAQSVEILHIYHAARRDPWEKER